jgi:hypothetical protein
VKSFNLVTKYEPVYRESRLQIGDLIVSENLKYELASKAVNKKVRWIPT